VVDYYFVRKRAFDVVRRAQAPISLIIRELSRGGNDLVAANDTRSDQLIRFEVRALNDPVVLLSGEATAGRDAVTTLGVIADRGTRGLYVLTLESSLGISRSTYLAGDPPSTSGATGTGCEKPGSDSGPGTHHRRPEPSA